MIVNLNLQGRDVVVVGGGREAFKRISSLLGERCRITVISDATDPRIAALAGGGRVRLVEEKVGDMGFFEAYGPDVVMATTDDRGLNRRIVSHARERRITAYSSDDPESSDFANLATVDVEGAVQIAVYTGGRSPGMARRLRANIEKNVGRIVSREDIGQIRLQEIARGMALERIPSQEARKAFLAGVAGDEGIKQLIKDGMLDKAEDRVAAMLRDLG